MRQSKLFGKTVREVPKDEVAKNAIFLERGGFVQKTFAGVYEFLPLGFRVLKKIETLIREEMNATGAQELLLPALHPLENYIQTGRAEIDVLFHTELSGGKKLVLGQSHEEIVTPLVQKFVSSYRDLPIAVYQIQTKFRNELRAKSGILRGREFIMKDCYSFHADEKDFERFYELQKKTYMRIFQRAGIGEQTFLTSASGGTFSKYSHEFQTITDAGEDIIHICEACKIAINDEIRHETSVCPGCAGKEFRTAKSIEVGNIFPLKTKFSDAFGFTFQDDQGAKRPVIMGCYGIGLGRLMGTIVEVHHDDKGIIWPESVAPFRVHLVELSTQDSKVKKYAEDFYELLLAKGVEVLYDDRDDKSAGEKFTDSDLIGIQWQCIISEKTLAQDGVEIKRRDTRQREVVALAQFVEKITTS
ncbi:MAG: aminoacyl--tRNA ligase-related protein [Patescibacteria group bacterium]